MRVVFETKAKARVAFGRRFEGPDIELAIEAMTQAVRFQRSKKRQWRSHLGGRPDVPVGFKWPIRRRFANLEEVKSRGGSAHGPDLERYGGIDVPYQFLAQIDCAEAHALGHAASELPRVGRLLFFYDDLCGPWADDDSTGHVMFESTSAHALFAARMPPELGSLEAGMQDEWRESMLAHQLDPDAHAAPRLMHPRRAISLRYCWAALCPAAAEMHRHPALRARLDEDDDFREAYDTFSAWDGGLFERRGGGMRLHRLLSPPVCVQREPRIHGVLRDADDWSTHPGWRDAAWRDQLMTHALDWRVLLQLDLADATQVLREGVVYFIILASDLSARDFTRVRAIYQQT